MPVLRRVSYANVTATLALVLAMSGGAAAANHFLITSTSQISPKVLKKLKGNVGAKGSPGQPGATGSPGQAGAKGSPGQTGANASRPNMSWRAALGIAEPSAQLTEAIDLMNHAAQTASVAPGSENLAAVIAAVSRLPSDQGLAAVAHRVLRSALEQRDVRQAKQQATTRNERLLTTAS